MILTKQKFLQIVPNAKTSTLNLDRLVTVLNQVYDHFDDSGNPKYRLAGFIAQCGHESGHFRVLSENLNYSAEGLNKTFRKYFPTIESAIPYQRQPSKIANKVYANRMGNGPESSGDGWKYRGRGLIQLTGKNNYIRCGKDIGVDLINNPDYAMTESGAIETATWFWSVNNINRYCDNDDIVGMTKAINNGTHGLVDRTAIYERAKQLL